MATYAQIFDLETPLEKALKAVLVAGGITPRMPVDYVNSDADSDTQSEEVTSGSVSIAVHMTGADQHEHSGSVAGQNVCDTFNAQLEVTIDSDRSQANATTHRSRVATVRALLHTVDLTAVNASLSYHQIVTLLEAASSYESDDQNNLDITRLTFPLIAQVRADAWP